MNISASQIKDIKTELAALKPEKVTLDGTRSLTVEEAVFALAPTLERMKKRGFDTQEIADKLHEKGIDVKPPTLTKYLNEFRRGKDRKRDTPPPPRRKKNSPHQRPPHNQTSPRQSPREGSPSHRTRPWKTCKKDMARISGGLSDAECPREGPALLPEQHSPPARSQAHAGGFLMIVFQSVLGHTYFQVPQNTLTPSGPWLIHGVAFPHSQAGDFLLSHGLPGVLGSKRPEREIPAPPLGRF